MMFRGWGIGFACLILLASRAFCASATPAGSSQAGETFDTEHIYICCIYGPDIKGTNATLLALKRLGARASGRVWVYTNAPQKKVFMIHVVVNKGDMLQALYTDKAHVIIRGHSNYGMGAVFATAKEFAAQTITGIRYMDDDRVINYGSPWVSVTVPRLLEHQSFPNWWPVFKDATSAVMPYDFNDPRGDPPYNYFLTYQLQGDPTWHRIETVRNSGVERFPGSDRPAWYAADGSAPDPANPDHRQYYIINTNASFETTGKWLVSSVGRGFLGSSYLQAPAGKGLNQAGWFFTIPTPGTYTVSAWWPASTRNVSSAQYSVTHASGVTTVKVNQKSAGGRWNKLGSFPFDAGEHAVVLTDKPATGTGTIVADAIQVTSLAKGSIPDQVIDATTCPKAHYGKKTIVFGKPIAIEPEKLAYTRLFYESCNSGPYYLGTFHRGLTFYTVEDATMNGFESYLKTYLRGDSDQQIWEAIQRIDPVYDYYDFTKSPADQPTGQSKALVVESGLNPAQQAKARQLADLTPDRALEVLKSDEWTHDPELSRHAVLGVFRQTQAQGLAWALNQLALPILERGEGRTQNRANDFLAARSILEAFPDRSVAALAALFGRSEPVTRGNIARAVGGIPGGDDVKKLLLAALEDNSPCEEADPESVGEPLRVCDVAYNQLVLRYGIKGVLRTIGSAHRMEVRDHHIGILKTRL
jgi:hypothetical protein